MRYLNLKNLVILAVLVAVYFILLQRESFFLAISLLWFAYPHLYIQVIIGIVYIYFVKKLKLEGIKQHLIGGGIAGLSFPLFLLLIVVPLTNLVNTLVDRLSPFPHSPTAVYSNGSILQNNILPYVVFGAVSATMGAIVAVGFYELWPLIQQYFKKNLGLGTD